MPPPATGTVQTVVLADATRAFHLRLRAYGSRQRVIVHERPECDCGCGRLDRARRAPRARRRRRARSRRRLEAAGASRAGGTAAGDADLPPVRLGLAARQGAGRSGREAGRREHGLGLPLAAPRGIFCPFLRSTGSTRSITSSVSPSRRTSSRSQPSCGRRSTPAPSSAICVGARWSRSRRRRSGS